MFDIFKQNFEIISENNVLPDIKQFYVNKNDIKQVLIFLKSTASLYFERLDCIICKDLEDKIEISYLLHSDKYNTKCILSCFLEYSDLTVESVEAVFKSANFDEREIYDLFGVEFINHPNLQRILLPKSFIGHPLRKNYIMTDERLMYNYE